MRRIPEFSLFLKMEHCSFYLVGALTCLSLVWSAQELTPDSFNATLSKKEFSLVMFYAPWCGHCKKAKPHFLSASAKLSNKDKKKMFALFNCDLPNHSEFCDKEKVEGFPTLRLYQKAKFTMEFEENIDEKTLLSFMNNPLSPENVKASHENGKESEQSDMTMQNVVYLSWKNFTQYTSEKQHVMVFFYTPWCPHCAEAKPMYEKAAIEMSSNKDFNDKILSAINCDDEHNKKVCEEQKIEGYPTLRYFSKGELFAEFEDEISAETIINFMETPPKEKQPITPIEEDKTSQLKQKESQQDEVDRKMENVEYLNEKNFKDFIKNSPFAVVMYYTPWCPHCQQTKPIFEAVAKLQTAVKFSAVNCDSEIKICDEEKIEAFPTLIQYKNGKRDKIYEEQPITQKRLMESVSLQSDQKKDEL